MKAPLILCLSILPFCSIAQDGGKVHRVVKDPPKELKPATDTTGKVIDVMSKEDMKQMEFQYTGTFTEPPAHPECKDAVGEARKACTAQQVLKEIRTRLNAAPPAVMPPAYARVRVGFDVDQYGTVKSVTVNYGGDDTMSEAVIQALYGLPRFIPAMNNGVRAGSHCSFSYAPALLFQKP